MLFHEQLGNALGMEHDTGGPAMVGRRDRHADRDVLVLCMGCTRQCHHRDGGKAH